MAVLKHEHLIVRAEILKPPKLNDLEFMNNWFRDVIKAIDMKILFGPYTLYHDIPGNRGFTGFAIIETSHVALHIWDEDSPALFELDVYTCSELKVETVLEKMKIFEPKKIEYFFLDRTDQLSQKQYKCINY